MTATAQNVSITLEFTPNPNTLKFVANYPFLERGTANFLSKSDATHSPLAQRIFEVPGITAVMIGTNFITITKGPEGNWDVVAEEVPKAIQSHLAAGRLVLSPDYKPTVAQVSSGQNAEIEMKIQEVLDRDIRPAVAMDGGDITFGRFEDGVVYLHLQGACSSCPSSIATLKMGVESRLRDLIPEVKEVVQM